MKGDPHQRYERLAAEQVKTLAGSVPADKAVRTALAMYILADERPTLFRSDQAFRRQLVRRMVGLSACNAGEYYDHKTGRMKKVYRDLPPYVSSVLGQWFAEAFGGAGLILASKEREDAQQKATEGQRLADALGSLQ